MSWLYLPESAAGYSEDGCLDGDQSATSKTTPIVLTSLELGLQRAICAMRRYGVILRCSTGIPGLDQWILSQRDSHASHSRSLGNEKEKMTAGTCGRKPSGLFGKCDHDTRSVRTCQGLLAGIMGTSDEYLMIFPKAGMMLDGELYLRPTWERPILGKGSGYWPTPVRQDGENDNSPSQQRRNSPPLNVRATWPTPRAQKVGGYSSERFRPTLEQVTNGGETIQQTPQMQLNPAWVEWLMGFPAGWTDLKPLAMHKFQEWLDLHGSC